MATPKTYFNILTKGAATSLGSTPIVDGKLRYTTDTAELYMDHGNERIKISDVVRSYTQAQILAMVTALPKIYIASDTGRPYIMVNGSWYFLGSLNLTATTDNYDKVVWISDATDKEPEYNSNFTYNPTTQTLKAPNVEASGSVRVGDMVITDTEDQTTGYHTVEFSFAS